MELTPVTVLTGFLGSGKTTLLKSLLRDPALARTAVVVNEFGAVGLDTTCWKAPRRASSSWPAAVFAARSAGIW